MVKVPWLCLSFMVIVLVYRGSRKEGEKGRWLAVQICGADTAIGYFGSDGFGEAFGCPAVFTDFFPKLFAEGFRVVYAVHGNAA